jgi:hypothetical protein
MPMTGDKPWYKSLGIWGSVVTIVVGVATAVGLISTDRGAILIEQVPELIVGLAVAVAGVLSFIGRWRAKDQIE